MKLKQREEGIHSKASIQGFKEDKTPEKQKGKMLKWGEGGSLFTKTTIQIQEKRSPLFSRSGSDKL